MIGGRRRGGGGGGRAIPLRALGEQLGLAGRVVEELGGRLRHQIAQIDGSASVAGRPVRKAGAGKGEGPASSLAGRAGAGAGARSGPCLGRASTVRSLSVRLGGLVPDTAGAARRAEHLFDAVVRDAMHGGVEYDRAARLSDLGRHRVSYEAACFYVAVAEGEGAGGGGGRGETETEPGEGEGEARGDPVPPMPSAS